MPFGHQADHQPSRRRIRIANAMTVREPCVQGLGEDSSAPGVIKQLSESSD
jgi:hypothetical protein